MKAIVFNQFGAPEVLEVTDLPVPELRPNDLLVEVGAAGVNRADILQRTGFYGDQNFGESALMGLEIAGKVVEVGSAVSDVAVGDRVMAIVGGGAYAEFARVDRDMAVHIPANVTLPEAAAIMESFVTAFEAVSNLGFVKSGQTVLIHAAAGGIGSAAVQVAKALGAKVFATTSADRKADVESIGADVVIDYVTQDFEKEIAAHTGGQGVHTIVDFVGGDYLGRNLRSLSPGGTLVQVGILSGDDAPVIPLNLLLHNHLRLVGTVMKSRDADEKRAMVRRFVENLLPLFENGKLRPILASTFPLDRASDAHRRMEGGGAFGKIVLTNGLAEVTTPA
ncbi:NADPH2:quinone reductase [Sphingomonas trueperi]|uniref:NAD(P)H-quinone oxidoreductase n=1 Tax=Sphingomonas trueperi TaxID=53317 RepID=UPI003395561C